jgi:RNA polymerase sigma-70 factor (TIGR02943 family)
MPTTTVEQEVKSNSPATICASLDPTFLVDRHGDYLHRYALIRVHDTSVAEDLVQETFLAALTSRNGYSQKSSERTWLTGILKHKIFDHFRRVVREELSDFENESDEEFFGPDGHWKQEFAPVSWNISPEKTAENNEFWRALRHGLSSLPKGSSVAFVLREIEGMTTDEICKMLNVSSGNLWVILHRARLHLRRALETQYFGQRRMRRQA